VTALFLLQGYFVMRPCACGFAGQGLQGVLKKSEHTGDKDFHPQG
jgi:hypothetical protein